MPAGRAPTAAVLALSCAVLGGVLGLGWWVMRPAASPVAVELAAETDDAAAELTPDDLEGADVADHLDAVSIELAERAPIEAEAVVAAAPLDPAALRARPRGVLVDEVTRAPVPDYRFVLHDRAGRNVTVVTDAEGRFAASEALTCGPVRVHYSERQNRTALVPAGELAAESGADSGAPSALLELAVACGPTYRLTTTPSDAARPEELAATLRWKRDREEDGSLAAAVHAGEPSWIRFGPVRNATDRSGTLRVHSFDGRWAGSAQVALESGAVHVALEAFAAIEARIVDPAGEPVRDPVVTLVLARADGSEERRDARGMRDGIARFQFLPSGAATLRVRAWRFVDADVPLVLEPAVRWKQDVTLAREPDAGAIRGLVLSDTGRYREDVWVRLVRSDVRDGPPPLSCAVTWTESEGTVSGAFAFEHMPPGAWQLSIAERDWYDWEPRKADVSAPLAGLALRVHDAVAIADLVVRTRAADGKSPADAFELRITSDAGRDRLRSEQGRLVVRAWPVEKAMRWRLDAEGCVPVHGTLDSFAPDGGENGRERRTCEVVLEPGWGELVQVVRADNRKPIEGATVLLDGREAARTDAQGRAFVRATAAPARIGVRWKDWTAPTRSARDLARARGQGLDARIEMKAPKAAKAKKP